MQESKAGHWLSGCWNMSSASHFGSLGYDYWPSYALVVLLYPKSVHRSILISAMPVCTCTCASMYELDWFDFSSEKNNVWANMRQCH